MTVLSIFVGLLTALGVWGFKFAFESLNLWRVDITDGRTWLVPVILVIAGIMVAVINKYLIGAEPVHGTALVMRAVALSGGRLPYRKTPAKTLGAILSIGAGASVGPEDPSVQIGSSLGSFAGHLGRLSDERVQTLVAAGAASAIAAAFNAPIAGVFFALEIILGEIAASSLGMVLIASVASSALTQALSGTRPAFSLPTNLSYTIAEYPLFIVLGVLCGLVSVFYVRGIYWTKEKFQSFLPNSLLHPILAALIVGIAGVFFPLALGTGYELIGSIMHGLQITLGALALLLIAKLVLTCISIGGGLIGGVFAPSLVLGAILGGLIGALANALFPALNANPAAFAVIGMSGVLAGAVHAPLTAALLTFELTQDYRVIVPLLLVVAVTKLISGKLFPHSVYSFALSKDGIQLDRGRDIEVLSSVTVDEVMRKNPESLRASMSLHEASAVLARTRRHGMSVLDAQGHLQGILTLSDIDKAFEAGKENASAGEICTRNPVTTTPETTLSEAMSLMSRLDVGRIPVVASEGSNILVGMLRRVDLVHAYNVALSRRATDRHRRQVARVSDTRPADQSVKTITVSSDSSVIGLAIKDIGLPVGCVIVSIKRGISSLVPRGDTIILAGDEMILSGESSSVEAAGDLLAPPSKNGPEAD